MTPFLLLFFLFSYCYSNLDNNKKAIIIKRITMKLKSLILHVIFLLNASTILLCQDKIKLYAIYTPSHEILKDSYFLPSIQDDFELIIENVEQTCESAKFMSAGWTKTTIKKVDLIIRAIQENWDSLFIFSDVDIQFF